MIRLFLKFNKCLAIEKVENSFVKAFLIAYRRSEKGESFRDKEESKKEE